MSSPRMLLFVVLNLVLRNQGVEALKEIFPCPATNATDVLVEDGTDLTLTCGAVTPCTDMSSVGWIHIDSESRRVSIIGDNPKPPQHDGTSYTVSSSSDGTACILKLTDVHIGDAGCYICVDLETKMLSNAVIVWVIASLGKVRDNSTGDADSCKIKPYHIWITAVTCILLVALNIIISLAACYYRRLIQHVRREDTKLDLDLLRVQTQEAALQKETELMTYPLPMTTEERYLSS